MHPVGRARSTRLDPVAADFDGSTGQIATPLAHKRDIAMMFSGSRTVWFVLCIAVISSCEVGSRVESGFVLPADFSCAEGLPGWQRAQVVTPDAVQPCMTGSSGSCADGRYTYVSGTGWCRPR